MIKRHTVVNLEQKIRRTPGQLKRQQKRQMQRRLAIEAADKLAARVQPVHPDVASYAGGVAEAFLRRSLKTFRKLSAGMKSRDASRVADLLVGLAEEDLKSSHAVAGLLHHTKLSSAHVFPSVDKSQEKVKPGPLVRKLLRTTFGAQHIFQIG